MNIAKKARAKYNKWRETRLIRTYCQSQSDRPRGAKAMNSLLILVFLSAVGLWQAADFAEAGINFILIFIVWTFGIYMFGRKENLTILQNCREKLAGDEFAKRIDEAKAEDVLGALEKSISSQFPVRFFESNEDALVGVYGNDKIVLVYRGQLRDDYMETKDIMHILHNCRIIDAKKVRIFTNTDFSDKADLLGQRYGMDVLFYNGAALKKFLELSPFYPTEAELNTLIKKESIKMQRKIAVIKKELLKKNKTRRYILYSLLLIILSKYDMGNIYLNLFFALVMIILAALSLIMNQEAKREEIIF